MNTALYPMYEWHQLNWRKLERQVFKLQTRIYRASQRGDVKAVHRLQRLLTKSHAAKLLAVRRVTQDNQGKKTAGVDGVKLLTPKQRLELVPNLRISNKAKPLRRVWIPKPGKAEKRPLGIPTIKDRARQALVKLALEPEWETRFEGNSYGFRPGRSCHDAIAAIFQSICLKPKYVLDADIAKCFDRIDHKALIQKVNTYPSLARQLRAWLKAGVMDGKTLFLTEEGTPQGGVISPLLANIALHGMEEYLLERSKALKFKPPTLIRYADDFVVIHESEAAIELCSNLLTSWLSNMGLEMKPEKTSMTHTLNEHHGHLGFNFLGFYIRQYKTGKYKSKQGFKTLIKPSPEKIKAHVESLKEAIQSHQGTLQVALIKRLNPIITGWANYYSTVVSKAAFNYADYAMFQQLRAWSLFRHPHKNISWVLNKYWTHTEGRLEFVAKADGKTLSLNKHADKPIKRHIKVQGVRSPFDGDWAYWGSRLGKHPQLPQATAKLLKQQAGKCAYCGLYFKDGDLMEVDHRIPKAQGGKGTYDNLQLLHRHCHDRKTSEDAERRNEGESLTS